MCEFGDLDIDHGLFLSHDPIYVPSTALKKYFLCYKSLTHYKAQITDPLNVPVFLHFQISTKEIFFIRLHEKC